jgi:hypothetical protein
VMLNLKAALCNWTYGETVWFSKCGSRNIFDLRLTNIAT